MNPSAAFAAVLADELVRCGMREAVLAPGSRSAPLALALHDRAAAGELRLHVRIDERSASFLALGLAKAGRRPVALVCTSGTAAAHFHAAVIEADEACVPLLVLTADRPPELRGTGANQTIDQLKLYGPAVRWFCEVGVPEARAGMVSYWRSLACRAWAVAAGEAGGPVPPGPVHLNVPLREPLVPGAEGAGGRKGRAPGEWRAPGEGRAPGAMALAGPSRSPAARTAPPGQHSGPLSPRLPGRPPSWPGPSAAWSCAVTAIMTRRRCSTWPRRPDGRYWPSRHRAPGAAATPCRPTATCSMPRPSAPRTSRTSSSRRAGPACRAASWRS